MIQYYLEKVIAGENLNFSESSSAMAEIMEGNVNPSHLAGFLIALKAKGETAEEVAGFAHTMKQKCIKIQSDDENVIDVCGTGGDNSGSFNISTAAAFAAAGAGVKVAKHGNKSISSKSGSADVLQELGVNINLIREQSEAALNKIGITFLFAPLYHPAMKHAAPVRKELGMKTVFNMLGPLTNPANVKRQLIGTFNNKAAEIMSAAAKFLEIEKACFVCTEDRYDEIILSDTSIVYEYEKQNGLKTYLLDNTSFNYPKIPVEQIKGDNPTVNAKIILEVFSNKKKNGAFHTITANSAVALYCAGYSDNLEECLAAAEESILSGASLKKLNDLIEFGKKA
jgi:anthranilate phosphoribosyltransferase